MWCYIKVSFLNHIASVLSERGLRCGAVYHPLYYVMFFYGIDAGVQLKTSEYFINLLVLL